MKTDVVIVNNMIGCLALKPAALITLDECMECDLYRGTVKVIQAKLTEDERAAGMSEPAPVEDVICGMPRRVRILRQIRKARPADGDQPVAEIPGGV